MVFEVERKCAAIHRVYPNTKICLSPILPTKSAALNAKANEFNSYLGQLSQKHPNLIRLDHTAMCGINGLLDSQYGRYRDGVPDVGDLIHLWKDGIKMIATSIKYTVLRGKTYIVYGTQRNQSNSGRITKPYASAVSEGTGGGPV